MDAELFAASERLARTLHAAPDAALDRAWAWAEYESEGVRFTGLVAYGYLRELAALLGVERAPATIAQRILGQYHAAYRDLQALLLGIDDELAEQAPAAGEWPVREALAHIVEAEATFFATVTAALAQHRDGAWHGEELTNADYELILGPEADFLTILNGRLSRLMAYHADLHARIMRELANISDAETILPVRFWETQIYQLRFRLQRFDAHARQHAIQIEKILVALGRPPSEGARLARLLYAALAEAEGQLIGAPDIGAVARAETAAAIADLADQAHATLR